MSIKEDAEGKQSVSGKLLRALGDLWGPAARVSQALGTRPSRLLVAGLTLLIAACGDPDTGPVDVKWDRIACERCRMVLSDRHHAAQVRVRQPNGRNRAYLFDDLGCAVIWLEDKPAKDDPATEIWVNDWRTGNWIDARTAFYVPGQVTPMEYGLGAQPEPTPGGLTFAQAREHIFEVERKYNVHGGHLEDSAPERQPQ
jgi:nitrous oxide reductase accessory protein NosL